VCVGKVMKCSMFPKIAKIYILSEEKTYLAFGVPFIDMLIFDSLCCPHLKTRNLFQ
jgi:hypothetical protein